MTDRIPDHSTGPQRNFWSNLIPDNTGRPPLRSYFRSDRENRVDGFSFLTEQLHIGEERGRRFVSENSEPRPRERNLRLVRVNGILEIVQSRPVVEAIHIDRGGSPPPDPRTSGRYYGRAQVRGSLPISEYSPGARAYVTTNLGGYNRDVESAIASGIGTERADCDLFMFMFWDVENRRLSFEVPDNGWTRYWADQTSGADSQATFEIAADNLKYSPTRSFMWDTLRVCLMLARYDTGQQENLTTRDQLFRLRTEPSSTLERLDNERLDFQCFYYAYQIGLSVTNVLSLLKSKGILSPEGHVLRVASPRELADEVFQPLCLQHVGRGCTKELVHAFTMTLLCLYELRAHDTVPIVLGRHCIQWVNLKEFCEYNRVEPSVLKEDSCGTSTHKHEVDQYIAMWRKLREREILLRYEPVSSDQEVVRRIFPESEERPEFSNIFGENYRYPRNRRYI